MQTIKVPDSLSDMTLKHLPFVLAIGKMHNDKQSIEDLKPHEVTDLNALFFGTELDYFDKFTTQSNLELLSNIIASCNRRKPESIRPFIEVDGKKYVWQSDYSKQPVSFHRDIARLKIEEHPVEMIGFCYVEEGMHYNTLDKTTKVVVNDRRERVKILEPHFNLAQYLDLHAFFLESYPVLRLSSLQNQLSKIKNHQPSHASRNRLNGRIQ